MLAAIAGTMCVAAHAGDLELHARIDPPPPRAEVTLRGIGSPFVAAASAGSQGRFIFRGLEPGSYTVEVFARSAGAVRRTVTISSSLAGPGGRVSVTIPFQPSKSATLRAVKQSNVISFNDYCTPPFAKAQYEKAQQDLGRRDVEAARDHLLLALKVAPDYADAWNNLGTIASQTGDYEEAERYFREALRHQPNGYSPLVNLGGALLARNRYEEALPVIRRAYTLRPEDALANALLGLSYFRFGDDTQAIEHLTSAKKSDPAHFTYPQLVLARIYSRQADPDRAAAELREFLACHPDSEESPNVQRWLALLQESGGASVTVVAEAPDPAPIPCDW